MIVLNKILAILIKCKPVLDIVIQMFVGLMDIIGIFKKKPLDSSTNK